MKMEYETADIQTFFRIRCKGVESLVNLIHLITNLRINYRFFNARSLKKGKRMFCAVTLFRRKILLASIYYVGFLIRPRYR